MADLYELADDGTLTLLGGYSPTSGHHHFPKADICPYSGADDVAPARLSRRGTLWAWTAINVAPAGYDGPVPYGFGIVELEPNALRVVGRLTEADPERLSFGQPMVVVADHIGDDVVTWAFAPEAEAT